MKKGTIMTPYDSIIFLALFVLALKLVSGKR
jgi:hypothetical protein